MREIYVITHPEATHVTDKLVGGWYDSELTATGKREAERIAQHLVGLLPDTNSLHLVTSDLRRAQQTADPIARAFGISPATDPDLRERSYGEAEGRAPGTAAFYHPPANGPRMNHYPGTPGTETRQEWATRVYRALDRVNQATADRAVVVTHGGTLTYIVSAWIGLPIEHAGYAKFSSTPGGITHLRVSQLDNDREVVRLDDVSQLE